MDQGPLIEDIDNDTYIKKNDRYLQKLIEL